MAVQTYTGRKKIVIPVTVKQFNEKPIEWVRKYLGEVVNVNQSNKDECKKLYQAFKGDHDIKNKTRAGGDNDINSIVQVNHLWRQVNFKKGFMVGKPIEYAIATSSLNTDDMTVINKYLRDSNKASKDIDKYEELYVCGLSHQFIIPRTESFDIEHESPFEICNLEIGQGFTVYSNDINNKRLFDVTISESVDEKNEKKNVYDIFYIKDGFCWTFATNDISNTFKIIDEKEYKQTYQFLPIVEYTLNKGRMGIIEVVFAIQNCVNTIRSNQVDDVIEFVNAYIVFKNQKIGKDFEEKFKALKKLRVLAISTQNPQTPADISLLKQSLSQADINSLHDSLLSEMYDIVGVPLSSGSVTSGGDTGSARLLGNGWESAQNQAEVDTSYIQQYEMELLKKMLVIAKAVPNTPIKEINASDVEIKYAINMSNNLLVKAQALMNLHSINMPYEEALVMTGITGDTHGVGKKWQELDEKKTLEEKTTTENIVVDETTNGQ